MKVKFTVTTHARAHTDAHTHAHPHTKVAIYDFRDWCYHLVKK
jgi:hypothetical protein